MAPIACLGILGEETFFDETVHSPADDVDRPSNGLGQFFPSEFGRERIMTVNLAHQPFFLVLECAGILKGAIFLHRGISNHAATLASWRSVQCRCFGGM